MLKLSLNIASVSVLGLALALAGCSDDDDDGGAGTGGMASTGGTGSTTGGMTGEGGSGMAAEMNILETAEAAGSFTTLLAAIEAAQLEDTLNGDGPFTVFAPTDDAFAALPDGTLDSLLLPENQQMLVDILTYHVVAGEVKAETVVTLEAAETVNGASVEISVADGTVTLTDGQSGNAEVTMTDIEASNGVIHVIDAVLLPPDS